MAVDSSASKNMNFPNKVATLLKALEPHAHKGKPLISTQIIRSSTLKEGEGDFAIMYKLFKLTFSWKFEHDFDDGN